MRQREQHDLSDEARRELDALDRALAGEPVDAEFDGVARLARDMRAERPEISDGFQRSSTTGSRTGFGPSQAPPRGPVPDFASGSQESGRCESSLPPERWRRSWSSRRSR